MPTDDLWYSSRRGPDGERLPTKRHGRGKRWRVRWIDDAGRARQRLFVKQSDAARFDASVRASVQHGSYIDPAAGRITVEKFGADWRATLLHDPATAERVAKALRLHIVPILGSRPLAAVRRSHITAWVKDRSAVLAPSTLRVTYSYLSAMFSAAVLDRVIGSSPCVRIALPEIEQRELFVPSVEQVEAMAEALPGRYRAQVVTAAGTGLRQGEVWGIELDRSVDWLRRELHVVQQVKVTDSRMRPYLAPPKTRQSRRTVEVGDVVIEALARHVEQFPPEPVEIDDLTDPRRPVRRTAKLVFTNTSGKPISRHSWSHTWAPARSRAGLPRQFTFHSLRDFYATLLIYGGASVKTVQTKLGHSTPTITLNTYLGHWPDALETTRALVDAAFGRPAPARLEAVR